MPSHNLDKCLQILVTGGQPALSLTLVTDILRHLFRLCEGITTAMELDPLNNYCLYIRAPVSGVIYPDILFG